MADTLTCSRNELAVALDVTPKHIDNLFNAGVVVKQARGEYDVIQSCKNYVKFLRGSNTSEKLDLTQERTRLTKYQADKAKLELDLLRGKSLPLDIMILYFQRITSNVRSMMMALSGKITTDILPGIDITDAVKIDDAIRGILAEAASMPIPKELDQRLKDHIKTFGEEENE